MHAVTTDKNRGYKFEGNQGEVNGSVWREEREGEKILYLNNDLKI